LLFAQLSLGDRARQVGNCREGRHIRLRHIAACGDRMPVVLGDVERWLNLDTSLDDVDPHQACALHGV
jgi:hypothetical protein